MKKIPVYYLLIIFSLCSSSISAKELTGKEADEKVRGAERIITGKHGDIPQFIQLRSEMNIDFSSFNSWAHKTFSLSSLYDFKLMNKERDEVGMIHYRYQQMYSGLPLEGTMFIVHTKNNKIVSVNGTLFDHLGMPVSASLDETAALSKALTYMNADKYRWEDSQLEKQLQQATGNPDATWFPKGELMLLPAHGNFKSESFRLAYRFDVYAEAPMKREYVYVDARSGEVIQSINRIRTVNSQGTAFTRYSGVRTITTDSIGPASFRLRETGRGLGIETYNLLTTTNYTGAVDFTDTDNSWNNVNAQQDEVATDAHWGAEVTYDFFMAKFGRNSINNAGQKLLSYVHYRTNYSNANWDGTEMNYGDGNLSIGYTPFTCLDVTGHEISHGLTENTSNLGASGYPEAGALNEGFSDCMGNSIRQFGKNNATINWKIGDEMGTPLRSMSNPKQYGCPDTYRGINWDFATQEVHQNSTIISHWFYLLTEGGAGTNDNGDTYSVTGIGLDEAAQICYRMNTIYLFPEAEYSDARRYAIQAALDLYGPCSNEVQQTVNAWHAVGVGGAYVAGVHSDFVAPLSMTCAPPSTLSFTNLSSNSASFTWDFGDGSPTTNAANPSHMYLAYGRYNVTLIADGGLCGTDTMRKLQYISIDSLNPCPLNLPGTGTGTMQTACSGQLFDSGGPFANYGDMTDVSTTIAPVGASTVTLTFTALKLEQDFDYLYIYDGPNTSSTLIGQYTGDTLPNGGTITSTTGSITIRQTSDQAVNYSGFGLVWQCAVTSVPPTPAFSADNTSSCNGIIQFTDHTTNGPASWHWNFGDGDTSNAQSPLHTYLADGTYTLVLIVSNAFGTDSAVLTNYITVAFPVAPVVLTVDACPGASATLTTVGSPEVAWYGSPVGGNPLHTGSVFNTPPVIGPVTYYAETHIFPASQYAGPVDNTFGGGSNFTNASYRAESFDALDDIRLVSVKVYAQGAMNRTITLIQGSTTLYTVTLNIPDGESRVTLNWDIPAGTNYELGSPGLANLFRNSGSSTYPYILNGLVSINGNVGGAGTNYYFFYNWEVKGHPCKSSRTPVPVNLLPSPVAAFTPSILVDSVNFADNSTGATGWLWHFDDAGSGTSDTSTAQNAVHLFSSPGTHNVCLQVRNVSGCYDSICQAVIISGISAGGIKVGQGISVFPNPVNDELSIQFNAAFAGEKCELKLVDVLGKTVAQKIISMVRQSEVVDWNVSSLAPGAYMLELISDTQKVMTRIIKQ